MEINSGETVATCEYCGTRQTLPRLDDDRRINLYDRANHFRRDNEFDKAAGIYEQILNEDSTDAEAYWSLVLCRYGIEYVEDPASHKHIPTVNRAQFTSIFDDENYQSAIKYADGAQLHIYEDEAKAINRIQREILAISQKEEPFDVFICYKEADKNGRRTPDSVLANDLYHQLTQEGFKVFFARITLEDKLGSAYEPYIFAALNSARVMVVLGTKPEYFNAVWVKNEWSRYLALVKASGGKKVLIPAFRDMDPYDLPEEFSHLQAQDMSKLGFMQDLIRGIKKITQVDESKKAAVRKTVVFGGSANTAPLLRRAFMFLEDGDWRSADEYCEKVLDIDPECAEAYLGKLMAELHARKKESLKNANHAFDGSNNYKKVMRFGDEELKSELVSYIKHIDARNEKARLEGIYNHAKNAMAAAMTEEQYNEAALLFKSIADYKNSTALMKECCIKAEEERRDAILAKAKSKMDDEEPNYKAIIELLEPIHGWKDADDCIQTCMMGIRRAEKCKKLIKIMAIVAASIVLLIIAYSVIRSTVIIPMQKYNMAVELMENGNVVAAYDALIAMDGYKDSAERAKSIYEEYKAEKLKSPKVGDYIFFGAYEQDNNSSNGKEDIEWLVLKIKNGRALVISRYALDSRPYDSRQNTRGVNWQTCELRQWLNDDFLNAAFSDEEKARIPTVKVYAHQNPKYGTDQGKQTEDKIFLLSAAEAEKYFGRKYSGQCWPTAYAAAQGIYVVAQGYEHLDIYSCNWWLRTLGENWLETAYVKSNGYDNPGGLSFWAYIGVRPVMWIELGE